MPPPLTPRCSPEAFVQETLRLLELERTSEELQSLAARGSCSPKEQEAAGLALRRMNIAAVEHGAGGRVYLRFEKYMQQVPGLGILNHLRFNTYVADGSSYLQPLPANKFGPGDVVAMKRQQVRS